MNFFKRLLKWMLIVLLVLTVIYFLGPNPSTPTYTNTLPVVPADAAALETYIAQQEAQHKVKPENEARIIWANDSTKQKTAFAIVYLHGFSASQEEGDPVHTAIAKKFGCNLFLARLSDHGIDTSDAMANLTAENYWESVKQAYAIGKQLGNKVIFMGTSTGGSNALQLAANYPEIASIILLSPNIEINDPNAWLANNPWGLQIARLVKGSNYNITKDQREIYKKHWYSKYRLESIVALQEYLETTMTRETFQNIKQPVHLLYYYKDEVHQDSVVKVSAMLRMFDELGTAASQKRKTAMPNTGDHVMGSYIKSNDYQGIEAEITKFMTEVLKMQMQP
ncbi:MAG: alpha/beta hydrolase [Chitinophagaceae bacterium]|jgi:esterase/lipase|nr:alpha/beta hydrolase [Chitinophagaceae bacterium]